MVTLRQLDVLKHAANLLAGDPWKWTVTVEYPGFLLVTFGPDSDAQADDEQHDDDRSYAAGFANTTLTVDQQDRDGQSVRSIDTRVHIANLDGYRLAIHTAAAIDVMEHAGTDVIL